MNALLCASPRCRPPGRHGTDCQAQPDKPCRGCLPAMAADGLRLCWHCTNGIGPHAVEAAGLHGELGLCLIGAGDSGEIRVSNPQPGIAIRETVVEHRTAIRHTMVSWALLVAEERGISLPWVWVTVRLPQGVHGPHNRIAVMDESTVALGRFIASHAQWLAAQQFAGEAADELAELVAKGRSLRQPSGTRIVEIGPCPMVGDEGACGGMLRALLRREASLLPSAVTCDADEAHSWDSTQWTKLGRAMKVRAA